MINTFVLFILFVGLPYATYFSIYYVKRVMDPEFFTDAFDKMKFSSLERYGYLVFCALALVAVLLIPPGILRCAIPAAGLGVSNALSSLNRGFRIQAFFAYFSAIFLAFYYFSDLSG